MEVLSQKFVQAVDAMSDAELDTLLDEVSVFHDNSVFVEEYLQETEYLVEGQMQTPYSYKTELGNEFDYSISHLDYAA